MRALFRSALGSVLAAAMTIAPTASIAAPGSVPDRPARGASGVEQSENLADNGLLIAGIGAVTLIIFVLIIDDSDEDLPTSP